MGALVPALAGTFGIDVPTEQVPRADRRYFACRPKRVVEVTLLSPARRDRVSQLANRHQRRHWLVVQATVWSLITPVWLLWFFDHIGLGLMVVVLVVGLVVLRAPLLKSGAATTFVTDSDPETVRSSLAGPYSPAVWQFWGVADGVETTETGGRYEQSTYFGLGSDSVAWDATRTGDEIRLEVDLNGTTKKVTTVAVEAADDGGSVVKLESTSGRTGLRNLPASLLSRSSKPVWNEMGFEVRERESDQF